MLCMFAHTDPNTHEQVLDGKDEILRLYDEFEVWVCACAYVRTHACENHTGMYTPQLSR